MADETIECPKCKHEHDPVGIHDEDSGEMECESCGFKFVVEIEYEPDYSTSCVEHEWGLVNQIDGVLPYRHCKHCQSCEFVESKT
jgi:transposase-like protein